MQKKLGISGTVVAVTLPIILAVYAVMGWKMPTWIATTVIVIASFAALVALTVLFHSIWVSSIAKWKLYALQFPLYRKDRSNPLQWLIDIAEKQKDNPTTHLVVTERLWLRSSFNSDDKRPFVQVRIHYRNLGVNDLLVSEPEGYATYRSEKLPNYIKGGKGYSNVPAEGQGIFNLDVYIPPEFIKDVCDELNSPTGELRHLGLSNVIAEVYIKDDDTKISGWNLGNEGVIYRPT